MCEFRADHGVNENLAANSIKHPYVTHAFDIEVKEGGKRISVDKKRVTVDWRRDRHRPAVAREGGAFDANRARQPFRAIVAYQDAVRRLQRAPLTLDGVPREVHRPDPGNGRRA